MKVGDLVRYQGSYYKVAKVHDGGRMVDLEAGAKKLLGSMFPTAN